MRRFVIRKKWYHDLFGKHRHKATFVAAFLVFVGVIGFILASTSITDITPDRGPSTGGQTIIITGSGFTDYVAGTPTNFTSTGCQVWTAPADGYYQLETWGAQGGNAGANAGGRGGYSTGTVYLAAGTQAWACVGGQGAQASRTPSTPQPGGANGGGGAYRTDNGNGREVATGGGGTDIRLNINSLYSRVIVAGGGGGASGNQWGTVPGGFGGGLTGGISTTAIGQPGGGGTQTAGGTNSATGCDGAGAFGAAFNCVFSTAVNAAGGGGGWFGGGSGLPGGGGSGFVHTSSNTPNSSTIGGQYLLGELHQMFNTGMADGGSSGSMPAPNGGTQTGQSGNGYARITQLPYFVTVGGTPCREVNILSDTQLSCVTPAHSASDAVVVVTIGDSTYTTGAGSANGGYTFTDALNISGPAALSGSNSGTYTVTLDYNYTGTVTLSDGGLGGTFSGANVVGGNQLVYSNQASRTFTYTPALGYQGDVVIVADSGNDYVSNGQITVTITTFATSFDMQCFADGSWTTNPFINPGTPLDCQIALNGAYDGVIDLTDFASTEIGDLGGSFTSTDSRFSAAAFNLSASDTINPSGQVLAFTYTSPTWSYLIDNLYEDDNGYMLFWPTLIATSSPNLNPAQQSVSVGLLAQAYEIYSLDTPPIGQNHGCTGCVARFGLSTFNAPYFGSITLSSDLAGNFDSGSGVLSPTLNISFSGSGNDETFRYTPDVIGEHTISGASGGPAVADSDISFNVIDSHILLTCTPSSVARGQSANCELSVNPADLNPGLVVSLQDLFLSYSLPQASGDGVFTDTSAITGTFSGGTYSFCGGIGGADCIGETYDRTFTYTLPLDTDSGYAVVRIQADSNDGTTTDSNWALLNIIPDTMEMYCSDLSPDCQTARVGALQDYIIQPNGMFAGTVQISDGDPYSIFSDNGIASWNFSADEFDFEYTPGSTGLKTITATVLTVDDPSSGIKVGDTYTFDVMVVADTITISGPDTVARDEVPSTPRFAITMNGPFVGTISGRIVRQDGAATIQFTSSVLVGTSNFTDNGNGTFSCSVTLANYNEATNTTTACMADSGAAEGFIFDYNWFEIQAQVTADPSIAPAAKTVGLVANRYAVTLDGSDATAGTIIATLGTPLTFTLTPNALFAGTYSFDDAGNGGYFLPLSGNIVRTQSQWPAFNNQTMQTAEFTYVPQETGYVTITVNALREAGLAPAGAAAMGEQTITLLVIADSLAIKGPATLVRGQLGAYTLELNGPYIGSVALSDNLEEDLNGDSVVDNEHHIRWPSDPDTLIPIGQAVCDFTLADYDEANNTTSCEFLFIVTDDSHYTNTADIFAATSEISTTATISIIADGFDVAPGPELNNQKINTPIEFTITPNAQFDGEFDITMVSPPVLDSGGIHYCPSPADFSGAFSPDHIDYAYSDYLTVGQDPVTRSFTFTPASFGRACFLVTPTASDGRTIAPQMIMVHTLDDMTLGGPTTMTRSPDGDTDSPTFTLSINGEYDGQVDFSLWNPITDSEISGAVITSDDGGASCTFV
ncbi:glycine-rich protein, partial [Candidatus Saccharibacteria bacterium]|nr:glycine-rich protein [Candidatus Saccharibacteria bacterium]